ncbi:winged helix-turn-helix domain-containing protein [Paraburkholderia sp. EG286B]|uniref:winged helix-turn-helix domain-containing protein n=1 Tax=Paraburkholderia sp. EG286B TaxID=3237011 RepID=UPI0034D24D89
MIAIMEEKDGFGGPPWAKRRAAAAQMLEKGHSIQQVAATLGLSRATARCYAALYNAGGSGSLQQMGDVGRRRQLPENGTNWLIAAVKHAPSLHGFPDPWWTREAIVELIERQFGIRYSRSHVNRLIRDHGLCEHVISARRQPAVKSPARRRA